MKKSLTYFILVTLLSLQSMAVIAQDSRFNGGIICGLNFAELEGSDIMDYFGLNTGLIGTVSLTKKTQLGIEFLFSQNGEYILPEYYPQLQYGRIRLNHIEIPLHINWLISSLQKNGFYNCRLNFGLAYTRLLSYKIQNLEKFEVSNQIIYNKKDAYILQFGTIYNFTKKIGLNLKASMPIRRQALDWTLAARMIYMFQ
jgi:Outer membrane protein beta-barrel domain